MESYKRSKEKNFISAVVYSGNDKTSLKRFLRFLDRNLAKHFERYEIICVIDRDPNTHTKAIERFVEDCSCPSLSVITMSFFHGLELSMKAGTDLSIGDFVLEFDTCAIDYKSSTIMDCYRECLKGNDIVSVCPASPRNRYSKLFYRIFNAFSNIQQDLTSESFRILSRRALNRVGSVNANLVYRKAAYACSGLKTKSIFYTPISKKDAHYSKEAKRSRRAVAINSLILFTDVGFRFTMLVSIAMLLITLSILIYTIVVFLVGNPITGSTTTMLLTSFSFFGLFSLIAIVIKYLDLLVDLTFKKKTYLIEGIEKKK